MPRDWTIASFVRRDVAASKCSSVGLGRGEAPPEVVRAFILWAYGKGWPWTRYSFFKDHHARPFYALRAGHP
jgi:hypothetical protein